jgi:hypothetical protein
MDRNGTPLLPKTFLEGFERKVADVVTPVAATQLIASRSQQSRAKVTRSLESLSQRN